MRTVPTIGCAGKEHHDYQFQYVYAMRNGQIHLNNGQNPPEAIIGMCRNCGDVYMVDVNRPRQVEESEEFRFSNSATQSAPPQPWENQGRGGIIREDGPTNSVPTPGPSNW